MKRKIIYEVIAEASSEEDMADISLGVKDFIEDVKGVKKVSINLEEEVDEILGDLK